MAFDFPSSPTIGQVYQGFVWDGEKWQVQGSAAMGAVRYDIAQGLTSAQASQARANIAVTKKNYIINGAMQISQENGGTAGSIAAVVYWGADQFAASISTSGNATFQQIPNPSPAGSTNRLRVTVTVQDAAVGATDVGYVISRLEGLRCADLLFGTASAKTVTLQFGVRAPAGTYCAVLANGAYNRSYVAEYVIAAGEANTDVVKAITIAGDVTGTWLKDNGTGLTVVWGLMCGTNSQQAAGSWGTGAAFGSANQFNLMGGANVFELFDVSLTEGTVAPPFQVPDYASELALCQRYFEILGPGGIGFASSGTFINLGYRFAVPKRSTPTLAGMTTTPAMFNTGGYFNGAGSTYAFGGFAAADAKGFSVSISGFTGLAASSGSASNTLNLIKADARL